MPRRFHSSVFLSGIAIAGALLSGGALAEEPPRWLRSESFESSDPEKKPRHVPISALEATINRAEWSDGIEVSVEHCGRDLCLDLISIPGETPLVAVVRVIFIVGRLTMEEFEALKLVDEGEVVYVIEGDRIREIGAAFVWGEPDNGQNPIHLNRMFVDAVRLPDGSRANPRFTGSLLGDTNLSMRFLGEDFARNFVLSALEPR